LFKNELHDKYSMTIPESLIYCLISCFWKFPKTAWRTMNCHQATHPISMQLWVPTEEPPGSITLLTKRRVLTSQFFGFCWIAWRWWTPAKRREPILVPLWCFRVSRMILIGEKGSFIYLCMIRCHISLNDAWLKFKLDEIAWISFRVWQIGDLRVINVWGWNCVDNL